MQKFAVRGVLLLVLVFGGGWFMGGILNLAALLSPPLVSMVQCPPGSTAKQEYKQLSFNQPGEKTLTFSCVNASGAPVTPLTDAESRAIENRIFYPAGVVTMAVIVAVWSAVAAARRGRPGARVSSSPA